MNFKHQRSNATFIQIGHLQTCLSVLLPKALNFNAFLNALKFYSNKQSMNPGCFVLRKLHNAKVWQFEKKLGRIHLLLELTSQLTILMISGGYISSLLYIYVKISNLRQLLSIPILATTFHLFENNKVLSTTASNQNHCSNMTPLRLFQARFTILNRMEKWYFTKNQSITDNIPIWNKRLQSVLRNLNHFPDYLRWSKTSRLKWQKQPIK